MGSGVFNGVWPMAKIISVQLMIYILFLNLYYLYTGSHLNSEVKQWKARLVLG